MYEKNFCSVLVCLMMICLLLAGCKEPTVPEPDKSTTTTQPTTITTNTPVDTTTYERVVIPITVIEQHPYSGIYFTSSANSS